MITYSEGGEQEFLIVKEVVTPDNKTHFVLSGPDKRRFLLQAELYIHYNISVGNKITCRIDKINCKGEIFLEPVNPFYSEGRYYFFVIKGTDIRTDGTGEAINVAVVTDYFGNENIVAFKRRVPPAGSRIKLLVERISKGRLILRRETGRRNTKRMGIGEQYGFEVEKIAKGVDNRDYFIVKDPFGYKHLIRREYYEPYGIKPGSKFNGKVVKYRTNGEMVIEPENPFYKTGSVLKLRVTDISENSITGIFTVCLADHFGHKHNIEMIKPPKEDYLLCRIVMIRKGRPRFEPLEPDRDTGE